MTGEPIQEPQTRRSIVAAWGLLVARLLARGYLVFLVALAACATVPMAFGLTGTVVQSGSMMPHIGVGDVVLSRPLSADAATPLGRVVTFAAPSGSAEPGIRLHRVVGTNADGSLITAGDANRDADSSPLPRADIIAVGCLLVPWVGLPAYWLQHGLLLPFAVWLALTLLALVIEFLASRQETQERRARRSRHALPPRRGIPALIGGIGPESALSVLSLLLCTAMVAVAPITPAASSAFTGRTINAANNWVAAVFATPVKLQFTTNPSNSTGGVAFGSQPAVAIRTSSGGATTSTAPVTLSISTPAGATLSCAANPVIAVAGTAHFSSCAVDKAGTYTLKASSPGLSSSVSTNFTVSVGPAKQLRFSVSPTATQANTTFVTTPVVIVVDAGGNVVSSTASIAMSLTAAQGATLTCGTNPKNAIAGQVSFPGCRISGQGTYTLTASSSGLIAGVSSSFTIGGPVLPLLSCSDQTWMAVFSWSPTPYVPTVYRLYVNGIQVQATGADGWNSYVQLTSNNVPVSIFPAGTATLEVRKVVSGGEVVIGDGTVHLGPAEMRTYTCN